MAANGKEEMEYESDPEDAKRSLAMRRREASDDEGNEDDGYDEKPRMNRRALIQSDESDGQGGAEEYYDEDEDEEEFDSLDEGDEVYDGDDVGDVEEIRGLQIGQDRAEVKGNGERIEANTAVDPTVKASDGGGGTNVEEVDEKKENEPFAVPTAGAFYMHDDRFRARDSSRGRHRRAHGARKLWESKDDGKWGHDKFEELNNQERQYEERRRTSRGRNRGRGKTRAADHVTGHGYNKAFNKNQSQAPKSFVRGRGPRKYEHVMKNTSEPQTQYKLSRKPLEKTSQANSKSAPSPSTKEESAPVPAKKHTFASNLSYASPPFYPSFSSSNLTLKKDIQAGNMSRNLGISVADENFSVSRVNASLIGKNIVDSVGLGKLNINESSSGSSSSLQMPSSGSSSMQLQTVQIGSVQSQVQQSFQAPGRLTSQHPVSGSNGSTPPTGKVEAVSEPGKPKGALVVNGKSSLQANGRGSLLYGATQLMGASGNVAVGHGDQNFPAFLPVMQFGGQHPDGIGLRPLGMAFPGYVGSPQSGVGNSEMTWLPVLAGAGALGSTYFPPYPAVEGSYNALSSRQSSSAGSSSREHNTNKPSSEWKLAQKSELMNNEFTPRQRNQNRQPRRYSEMSFSK